MGCKVQTKEIKLEAARVTWGKQACRKITAVADDTDSLDGEFITLEGFDSDGVKTSYVIGKGALGEQIDVSFATDADAPTVSEAFVDAINGITGSPFVAEQDGASFHVLNRFRGKVEDESMGDTGFTYNLEVSGVLVDMGDTEGAIELSIDTTFFDVTTNQNGELVIDQLYQGAASVISADFVEVTKERFDTLVGEVVGDSLTPDGGTKVTGFGQSRLFQSMKALSGKLVLHPIRLPNSDKGSDVVFWKSAPIVDGLNFDGTAPQALSVSFNAYLDDSKNEKINLWARGDWTQEGLDA